MENQQSEKPRPVVLATGLLWGSLAIGVIKIPLDLPALNAMPHATLVWIVLAAVLAFYGLLVAMISSGRNWARITFLVLFLLGLVFAVPTVVTEFERAPVIGALSVVQTAMQAYALFLLFTAPGKDWFRKKAPSPAP